MIGTRNYPTDEAIAGRMGEFKHLSRVGTRFPELGLFRGSLWFEFRVATVLSCPLAIRLVVVYFQFDTEGSSLSGRIQLGSATSSVSFSSGIL